MKERKICRRGRYLRSSKRMLKDFFLKIFKKPKLVNTEREGYLEKGNPIDPERRLKRWEVPKRGPRSKKKKETITRGKASFQKRKN